MDVAVTNIKDGYAPQLWSLENGYRYALPYEKAPRGVTFKLKLEAAGSAVIVFTRDNDAQKLPEETETVEKYTLDGTFEYECDEPQACVLDFARWKTADGEFSAEAESLKIDQQVRDHFGMEHRGGGMLQPWYSKLHDKKIYGDIELEYTFDIEKLPEGPVYLCGERPEFNSYFINGIKLECPDSDDIYIDNCLKKMPVPDGALKTGENKVTVKVAFMRTTNIEALYLIGRFGVKIDGHKRTLTSLPDRVGTDDLINYSMPFYTGRLAYKLGASLFRQPGDGERMILKADRFKGGLVKVVSEGKLQILAWEPYEADITDAVKNGADIDVVLVQTRRNLFGPLHLVPAIHGAYGPGHFVTGGDMWTDDYSFVASRLGELTVEHKK